MSESINRIDDAAATWALRLGTRSLSPEERRELDAWIAADVRHHGALIRARSAWTGLDRFAALAAGGPIETTDAHHSPAAGDPSTLPSPNRRWVLAAGLSAMTVGTAAWLGLRERGAYVTEVGEFRSITLPDGSVMRLNTDSKALVGYGESHREVALLRGEAMFDVAKDPARPFLVRTGQLVVRAVGTAFAASISTRSRRRFNWWRSAPNGFKGYSRNGSTTLACGCRTSPSRWFIFPMRNTPSSNHGSA